MNDPYSVIEDLTPEPERGGGGGRWRDLALGLVLIVLVVGFACWQWWHTEQQSSNYRAGQDAMSIHDWDAAIDYFHAASGYLDADDLLEFSSKELAHTEEVYEQGMAYANDRNWIAAMQTLGELKEEQPSYKDTNKTWDEAREQVYKEALQGTVVSRSRNGDSNLSVVPAGGKFNDFGGWYPLRNSDSYSRVLGGCTDGKILYDIPGKDWAPKQVISSNPNGPPTAKEQFEGRILVVGNLLTYTDPDFLRLDVDPSAYDRFLCGRTGLWLYNYGAAGAPDHFPSLDNTPVRDVDAGYSLTYVAFDGTVHETFAYSNTTDAHEIPVAIDYGSNRMVVAKWSGEDPKTGHITQQTQVELYLITLDGTNEPKLIFQTKWNGLLTKAGGIQSVEISPNGRYVLVNEFVPLAFPGKFYETEVRFIVDTKDTSSLLSPEIAAADFGAYHANWISSDFITHGAFAGKVISSKYIGDKFEIELLDPANPGSPIVLTQVDAFFTNQDPPSPMHWTVAKEDFDGVTLVGREDIRNGATLVAWALTVVSISADGEITTTKTTTANGWLRSYPFLVAANRLIYTSDIDSSKADWVVWSTPISEPEYNGADASLVYGARYATSQPGPPFDSVSFGTNLLAYIEDNSLHARSYDGLYDVTLETGINRLSGTWRYFQYINELK
jgi:hypothetical protein